jgi:predicted DNA-binding protein (UPF0251 family)
MENSRQEIKRQLDPARKGITAMLMHTNTEFYQQFEYDYPHLYCA